MANSNAGTNITTRAAGPEKRRRPAEGADVILDVLQHVQPDHRRVGTRRRRAQVDPLDRDPSVAGEPSPETLQDIGVDLGHGHALDTALQPQARVPAEPTPDLERVLSEVRPRQVGEPRVVVLCAFERLENAVLDGGVHGRHQTTPCSTSSTPSGRRNGATT
jgi:hypothetical protein